MAEIGVERLPCTSLAAECAVDTSAPLMHRAAAAFAWLGGLVRPAPIIRATLALLTDRERAFVTTVVKAATPDRCSIGQRGAAFGATRTGLPGLTPTLVHGYCSTKK